MVGHAGRARLLAAYAKNDMWARMAQAVLGQIGHLIPSHFKFSKQESAACAGDAISVSVVNSSITGELKIWGRISS